MIATKFLPLPTSTPTPPPSANRDELLREKEKPERNEQQCYYNLRPTLSFWTALKRFSDMFSNTLR